MHDLNLVTLALNLVKLAQTRCLTFNAFCTILGVAYTAQKTKFSIKDFFSKCDQIRSFLWIWSHLLKKSLVKNITFLYSVITACFVENAAIQHLIYFHFVTCTILREFNKKQ